MAFGSVTESALISLDPISLGSGIWLYFTALTCTVMQFIDDSSSEVYNDIACRTPVNQSFAHFP